MPSSDEIQHLWEKEFKVLKDKHQQHDDFEVKMTDKVDKLLLGRYINYRENSPQSEIKHVLYVISSLSTLFEN